MIIIIHDSAVTSQIAKFMGPTWGPPGSSRPQMGPMLAPWTLLSGMDKLPALVPLCEGNPCHWWVLLTEGHKYITLVFYVHSLTNLVNNKASLRDLIAATGVVMLLKLDSNHWFFSIISKPSMNSNWIYSPEILNSGLNLRFCFVPCDIESWCS